jgi:PAS domain S-box-containing protein
VERLGDTVAGTPESAAAARAEAAEARAAAEGLADRLTAADERAAALRGELTAGRERLDAVGTQVERIGESVTASGEQLRGELSEVRTVAETANRGLQELRAEIAGVRQAAETIRADAAEARAAARRSDDRVEAMQAEVTFALSNLDEVKQGLSSAGQAAVIARREAEQARKAAQIVGDGSTERVTEVFQQILGLAAARNAGGRRPAALAVKKPEPVKREPRHGFDDVTTPMAILALDGKFKELNPAFARLVGYQEHEFTKAAWPSPHDRRDYKDQLEQLRRLGLGELEGAEVQSTYMHGQGLMVPVVGKLTLKLGEDGLPLHLLLEAEDRHTH